MSHRQVYKAKKQNYDNFQNTFNVSLRPYSVYKTDISYTCFISSNI
jgi:hypothetical protein